MDKPSRVSFTLDSQDKVRLQEYAAADFRSTDSQLRKIVVDWLNSRDANQSTSGAYTRVWTEKQAA